MWCSDDCEGEVPLVSTSSELQVVSAVKVEEAEGHVVTAVILRGPVVLNGRLEGTVVLRLS